MFYLDLLQTVSCFVFFSFREMVPRLYSNKTVDHIAIPILVTEYCIFMNGVIIGAFFCKTSLNANDS